MRAIPDQYATQHCVTTVTNTNTATIVINASADDYWLIKQVIWSIDRSNSSGIGNNEVHLDVIDSTANTIRMEVGIEQVGKDSITFAGKGLCSPKGHEVTIRLVDEGSVVENHLTVIYQ